MKELRDIKIDMVTGNQNPIIELFNQITDGVVIINCEVYNKEGMEFIYHKDGEWIFFQDLKNEKFWCNYDRYWQFFECEMGLRYFEIQSITKYLVEEALKREMVPSVVIQTVFETKVEEALKREVVRASGRKAAPSAPAIEYGRRHRKGTRRFATGG